MGLGAFENKSVDELKELLELGSKKADNEWIRLICWILSQHVTVT